MTTAINTGLPSLLDIIKLADPNGAAAHIIEMLNARNAIVKDAVFVEGNLPTGHRISNRTGLPSVGWRRLNEGVTIGKSRVDQYDETCAILSGISKCDVGLAEMAPGGPAAYRLSQSTPFIEAMSQEMESSFAYASIATAPEELNGIIPRLAATTGPGGSQITLCDSDASGADQTSVLLIGWGPAAIHGIYPRGSASAGVVHTDMGEQLTTDSGGTNQFRAFVDTYDWKVGFAVENFLYMHRVANIDAVNMAAGTSPLIDAMIEAWHGTESGGVRQAWYCNRAVSTYLHKVARNDVKNATLSIDTFEGKPVVTFMGVPIRQTDGILSTEDVIA